MGVEWINDFGVIVQKHFTCLLLIYISLFVAAIALYFNCTTKKQSKKTSKRKYKVSINGTKLLFNEGKLNNLTIKVLKLLALKCELFILTQVKDDKEEEQIKSLCQSSEITPLLVKTHVISL